jgi:hypothetical protein
LLFILAFHAFGRLNCTVLPSVTVK